MERHLEDPDNIGSLQIHDQQHKERGTSLNQRFSKVYSLTNSETRASFVLFFLAVVFLTSLFVLGMTENRQLSLLIELNGILWLLPVVLQLSSGVVDPFHPLVMPAVFFALPNIIIRGISFLFGGHSYILDFTDDPMANLCLALQWTAIGWTFVMIGFYLPPASKFIGNMRLPSIFYRRIPLFCLAIMVCLGLAFNYILMNQGAYGSSLSEFSGNLILVSVARPLSGWFPMSFFLLVFSTVRNKQVTWRIMCAITAVLGLSLTFLSGSRAALFNLVLTGAAASYYARFPAIRWRRIMVWGLAASLALILGVLFISQYRILRQRAFGTEVVSMQKTADLMQTAVKQIAEEKLRTQFQFVMDRLLERFSAMEFFGVTLGRAADLQWEEKSLDMDNNIIRELFFGFIPRPLWSNKPETGQFGLKFTRLYLNCPACFSSSGPTVFGDLSRNFGLLGIPIGMFFVGIFFRFIYEGLILRASVSPLAALFYFNLLGTLNWEGTYSNWIPTLLRVSFSLVLFTGIINFFNGRHRLRTKVTTWRGENLPAGKK